jgi:hypothetical protein
MGVSEGYAYYGLYPQMYIESVRRFFDERQPHRVTVVGLRNIGTSLSATVAGTLHELGVTAGLYTVRPHGHPFERELKLAPPLVREWQSASDGWFLIVDEGPGLSGSSLTAAAEAVAGLGVPDERIVLFPGWEPDGTEFISARARARWIRHSKYSTGFDAIWVDSGRLATEFGPGKLSNMSG